MKPKPPGTPMSLEPHEVAVIAAIRKIDRPDRVRVGLALAESIISYTVGAKAGQAAIARLKKDA